jgi:hypothetical protein
MFLIVFEQTLRLLRVKFLGAMDKEPKSSIGKAA